MSPEHYKELFRMSDGTPKEEPVGRRVLVTTLPADFRGFRRRGKRVGRLSRALARNSA